MELLVVVVGIDVAVISFVVDIDLVGVSGVGYWSGSAVKVT